MSDSGGISDTNVNLQNTDMEVIARHYNRLITGHIERAKLPKVYGWTSQVMMALIWRLGKTPLEISLVAEELEVPNRTLQNHLSEEGTSFSYLRDHVRRHFAIKMLIAGETVENIFPMLDFQDRTGLINAFKRWTGLPPTHFRKLYNVYVRDADKK